MGEGVGLEFSNSVQGLWVIPSVVLGQGPVVHPGGEAHGI